jgi:hypothetical protein
MRDARLGTLDVWLVCCAGLCVAVGFFASAGVAAFDSAAPDSEELVAGAAVDCATPDRATPDPPAINNPNRRIKLPEPRLNTGNGQ